MHAVYFQPLYTAVMRMSLTVCASDNLINNYAVALDCSRSYFSSAAVGSAGLEQMEAGGVRMRWRLSVADALPSWSCLAERLHNC